MIPPGAHWYPNYFGLGCLAAVLTVFGIVGLIGAYYENKNRRK